MFSYKPHVTIYDKPQVTNHTINDQSQPMKHFETDFKGLNAGKRMKTFIVKPDGGMQGAGIFLVRSGQVRPTCN